MPRKKGRTSTGYSLEARPRVSGKPHWRVRVWTEDPVSGQRKLQIIGTYASKTEAQREGARAVEHQQRGTLLPPQDITVGELLDLWLTQEMPKTVRPENQESYRSIVANHLQPGLGAVRVQRLSVQASRRSIERLRRLDTARPSSASAICICLRHSKWHGGGAGSRRTHAVK